jgi:hypothetical protein
MQKKSKLKMRTYHIGTERGGSGGCFGGGVDFYFGVLVGEKGIGLVRERLKKKQKIGRRKNKMEFFVVR